MSQNPVDQLPRASGCAASQASGSSAATAGGVARDDWTSSWAPGGHLAALLATSGDVAEAEGTTGENLENSSRIQAAVDYFGPTD